MEGMPATAKPGFDDDQDGIRRRLRDRDLLKRRKAEAEEKATTQAESKKKRAKVEEKSTSGRRGRPRKTNQTPELSAPQEELGQGGAVTEEVPKPAESILVPTLLSPPSFPAVDNTLPAYVPLVPATIPIPSPAPDVTPAPVLASGPLSTPAAGPVSSPDSGPVSSPATGPVSSPDAGPVSSPAAGPVSSPDAGPVSASALPPLETLYTDSVQGSDPKDWVLIEDLGPDEEEDVLPSRDNLETEQGSNEERADNVPEQSRVYSTFSVLSTGAPSQDSLSGNIF